jgi:methionyl-tRNA formyltransferase
MKFNKINKVILFGGAPLLAATVKLLNDAKIEVIVFTSPRHAVEILDSSGCTLREALDISACKYIETEDINTCLSLRKEITEFTLGIGMGEAWTFDEDLINLFRGRLLDFMGIPLPRYRGGAHYTWMILRGDMQGGWNEHVLLRNI